ncbi:uncharacterized protein LOC5509903 isoform X2 [Nematostella vectensis]|uniref:uncharacterized protein LOC5509903 isoform X2 n=1 Tax=Nematostella vectensis TaxID=45351 RepID=UPI0020775A5F|nr:uncharacterized protein LOC5509903 isoform X2 [Nematostella vectensis]
MPFSVVVVLFLLGITPFVFSDESLRYCGRLATFPQPEFKFNFTLRSQNGQQSFKEVRHGLAVDPFFVRVYAKPQSGPNQGFCFNGVGANQASYQHSSYGGLIYAYNSEFVRVWAPTSPNGFIVFIKDGWAGEKNAQQLNEAHVFVEVWGKGPEPNFDIDTVIGNGTVRGSYGEVDHRLRQVPDRIVVRVSPESHSSSNGGFWFPAISTSQNSDPLGHYGGVIYAFNERLVRLWIPSQGLNNTGCILLNDLWGGGKYEQLETRCRINVKIWVNQFPVPAFQSNWTRLKSQLDGFSFKEISHNLGQLPENVVVQVKTLSGMNVHSIFLGQGSVQSDDNNTNGYGGVTYAYNENKIRMWMPSRNDGSKLGYMVLVNRGWGDGLFLEKGVNQALVRVLVYSSVCDGSEETALFNNQCVKYKYQTYGWRMSDWSSCSSICNQGQRSRKATGCSVTSKKKLAISCDFEKDTCGWIFSSQTVRSMEWRRTKGATPTLNTGPQWGHPKGSYYVYTYSDGVIPEGTGTLDSPMVHGRSRCHLTFFWSMFGNDVGNLSVYVSTAAWGSWVSTGWSMEGSQGPVYWRSAYVNLEQFIVYRIRFEHTLPRRPSHCDSCGNADSAICLECKACPGDVCPRANVAIDDVKLMCEELLSEKPPELCRARSNPLPGCERQAVIRDQVMQGPAYSQQWSYDDRGVPFEYVRANGSQGDVLGTYTFDIHYTAEYTVWMNVNSTDLTVNEVEFRIDEGEWKLMIAAAKKRHHLWLMYRLETFKLHPGSHTITFRQYEFGFQYDRIILAPSKLEKWSDLGMQSRHIPDSYLSANIGSLPKPRFGRLNAPEGWCSSDQNSRFIYLQVKLPNLAMLSRIAIQGGKDIFQKSNDYWIKSFLLKVSLDDGDFDHFTWYRDRAGKKEFIANKDASSITEIELPFAAPVRAIRIYPETWNYWPCLRIELYGIYLSESACAASGLELPTRKPCIGDRNCGSNAACHPNQSGRIEKKGNSTTIFPTPSSHLNTTESCYCLPGYHGDGCQHYGCTPNPCQNGGTCKQSLQNGSFVCACAPGFHGNTCQLPCPDGQWGIDCKGVCTCSEYGSCDSRTGKCHCMPGYSGPTCIDECPTGYYGYECTQKCQCVNGASCDRRTGSCNCTVGWIGKFCQHTCPHNTWGEGCARNCSCSASALMCDRMTGECICPPGWYGRYCKEECPRGIYGRNCSYTCQCAYNQTCSKRDGLCDCRVPGVTGVTCRQPCRAGFFGIDCNHKCPCMNGAECDRVSGVCSCSPGWTGPFCSKPCPPSLWGHNCAHPCNCTNGARCNAVTGQCACTDGCSCNAGWTGPECRDPCGLDSWGPGCTNTCQCSRNGECDAASGRCACAPGFTGDRCESRCPKGYYGTNCSNACTCKATNTNVCDVTSGFCHCNPGWSGRSCYQPCPGGSWGVNCSSKCDCINGSCDPVTGACVCNRRVTGQRCDKPCINCNSPCPKCYHSNGACNAATGKCVCLDGYHGDSCLEACSVGYFGRQCQSKCQCLHGYCDHVTGSCECLPGWTGKRCDQACPSGTYGFNCTLPCACVNGSCNATDGSCNCAAGYHGNACDRPCPAGKHGANCGLKCLCANNGTCNAITGRCSCGTGWTGPSCNASCSAGRYGINCVARCQCESCDRFSGKCHCPPGYQGHTCSQVCPKGFYGSECIHPCPCANNGTCDHVTGSCTCRPGWTGKSCKDPCPAGRYGMMCASSCRCDPSKTDVKKPCDHVTGQCNCRPGYRGPRCLEQCPEGRYGDQCARKCECDNRVPCRATDGVCLCLPGYYGNSCQLTCPRDRYGFNCSSTCQCVHGNTRMCDKKDGSCACADGYVGVLCENRCPQGTYGPGCHNNCTCLNGAQCDHVTGTCTCPVGYKGKDCDVICDKGTFGPGCTQRCLCENGAKCDRKTGACTCAPGFEGLRCSRPCLEGRYGDNCTKICDCNPRNTRRCDNVDGKCLCTLGYTPPRCDKLCQDGFYGQDCRMRCPDCSRHVIAACNKHHGNCTCAAGFYGYQCYDPCESGYYGVGCASMCTTCSVTSLCDHVHGTCIRYTQGLFHIVVMEDFELFSIRVRQRDLRLGLERLMETYFDIYSQPDVAEQHTDSQVKPGAERTLGQSLDVPATQPSRQRANRTHDFTVRILELERVMISRNVQKAGTRYWGL